MTNETTETLEEWYWRTEAYHTQGRIADGAGDRFTRRQRGELVAKRIRCREQTIEEIRRAFAGDPRDPDWLGDGFRSLVRDLERGVRRTIVPIKP